MTLGEIVFGKAKRLRHISYVGFALYVAGFFVMNAMLGYRVSGMILGGIGFVIFFSTLLSYFVFLRCPKCGMRFGFLMIQPDAEKTTRCPSCGVHFDEQVDGDPTETLLR